MRVYLCSVIFSIPVSLVVSSSESEGDMSTESSSESSDTDESESESSSSEDNDGIDAFKMFESKCSTALSA